MSQLLTVVDDDQSVRESLRGFLASVGFRVESFPSAEAFLESDRVAATNCLILDVRMPGMSGPELQQELARRGYEPPIVYVTSYTVEDIRHHVHSGGRVTYLLKPFTESALLQAIDQFLPAR